MDVSKIKNCPHCGSGDVHVCNISVRPYCDECGHWGAVNFGSIQDAVERWNDTRQKNDIEIPVYVPPQIAIFDCDDVLAQLRTVTAVEFSKALNRSITVDDLLDFDLNNTFGDEYGGPVDIP